MQIKILAVVALFTAISVAQLNVDKNLLNKLSHDANAFQTAVYANPTYKADIAAIASAAPASVLKAAGNNPTVLIQQLATLTKAPSWLPTPAANQLASIVGPGNKAQADFNSYINSVAAQPSGSSLLNALYNAAPASVQSAYSTNKLGLAVNLITARPTWATAVPASVQSGIGAVYNSALKVQASDLEAALGKKQANTGVAKGTGTGLPTKPPVVPPFGTGRPSTCPFCPVCPSAVTIYSTVTAGASSPSQVSLPSNGVSGPATNTPAATAPVVLPSVVQSAPTPAQLASTGQTVNISPNSTSVATFTGAAAPMRTAAAGVAALVAGAGALILA